MSLSTKISSTEASESFGSTDEEEDEEEDGEMGGTQKYRQGQLSKTLGEWATLDSTNLVKKLS